jgi:hypothetical protein
MRKPVRVFQVAILVAASALAGTSVTAQSGRPAPKILTWQAPSAAEHHVAILGQVRRPGVYRFSGAGPAPGLPQIVEFAGGLTANASSTLRLVRHGRSGQLLFLNQETVEQLQAGDVLIVDEQSGGGVSRERLNADEVGIQVALVGLLDRPVVLKLRSAQARLDILTSSLNQPMSAVLAARVIRSDSRTDAFGAQTPDLPLGNGAVVVYDPRSILRSELPNDPTFDLVVDTTQLANQAPIPEAPLAMTEAPAPPRFEALPPLPEGQSEIAADVDSFESEPTPLPPDSIAAAPVPDAVTERPNEFRGSHGAPAPSAISTAIQSQITRSPIDSTSTSPSRGATSLKLTSAPPPPRAETAINGGKPFSAMQMLVVFAAVMGLIGGALGVRQILDRRWFSRLSSKHDEKSIDGIVDSRFAAAMSDADSASSESIPEPESLPAPLQQISTFLEDLLHDRVAIVEEAPNLPRGLKLQARAKSLPQFRVDGGHELASAGPHATMAPSQEAAIEPKPVEAAPLRSDAGESLRAPHFVRAARKRPTSATSSAASTSRRMTDPGTPISRALSQLQQQKPSESP